MWNAWSEDFGKWIEDNKIKDGVIDCSGMIIDRNVFGGYVFSADTYFSKAQFTGNGDFNKAVFRGNADFSDAQFTSVADFNKVKFASKAHIKGLAERHYEYVIFMDEQDINYKDDIENHASMTVLLSNDFVSAANFFYLLRGITAAYNNYYYLCTTDETDHDTIRAELSATFSRMEAKDELYVLGVREGSVEFNLKGLADIIPGIIKAATNSYCKIKEVAIAEKKAEQDIKNSKVNEKRAQENHESGLIGRNLEHQSKYLDNAEKAMTLVEKARGNPLEQRITNRVMDAFDPGSTIEALPSPISKTIKENMPLYVKDATQHLANGITKNTFNDNEITFKMKE